MFADIFAHLFTLQTLMALAVGVIGGIIIGALPGLGATMGIDVYKRQISMSDVMGWETN